MDGYSPPPPSSSSTAQHWHAPPPAAGSNFNSTAGYSNRSHYQQQQPPPAAHYTTPYAPYPYLYYNSKPRNAREAQYSTALRYPQQQQQQQQHPAAPHPHSRGGGMAAALPPQPNPYRPYMSGALGPSPPLQPQAQPQQQQQPYWPPPPPSATPPVAPDRYERYDRPAPPPPSDRAAWYPPPPQSQQQSYPPPPQRVDTLPPMHHPYYQPYQQQQPQSWHSSPYRHEHQQQQSYHPHQRSASQPHQQHQQPLHPLATPTSTPGGWSPARGGGNRAGSGAHDDDDSVPTAGTGFIAPVPAGGPDDRHNYSRNYHHTNYYQPAPVAPPPVPAGSNATFMPRGSQAVATQPQPAAKPSATSPPAAATHSRSDSHVGNKEKDEAGLNNGGGGGGGDHSTLDTLAAVATSLLELSGSSIDRRAGAAVEFRALCPDSSPPLRRRSCHHDGDDDACKPETTGDDNMATLVRAANERLGSVSPAPLPPPREQQRVSPRPAHRRRRRPPPHPLEAPIARGGGGGGGGKCTSSASTPPADDKDAPFFSRQEEHCSISVAAAAPGRDAGSASSSRFAQDRRPSQQVQQPPESNTYAYPDSASTDRTATPPALTQPPGTDAVYLLDQERRGSTKRPCPSSPLPPHMDNPHADSPPHVLSNTTITLTTAAEAIDLTKEETMTSPAALPPPAKKRGTDGNAAAGSRGKHQSAWHIPDRPGYKYCPTGVSYGDDITPELRDRLAEFDSQKARFENMYSKVLSDRNLYAQARNLLIAYLICGRSASASSPSTAPASSSAVANGSNVAVAGSKTSLNHPLPATIAAPVGTYPTAHSSYHGQQLPPGPSAYSPPWPQQQGYQQHQQHAHVRYPQPPPRQPSQQHRHQQPPLQEQQQSYPPPPAQRSYYPPYYPPAPNGGYARGYAPPPAPAPALLHSREPYYAGYQHQQHQPLPPPPPPPPPSQQSYAAYHHPPPLHPHQYWRN
ncbi:hypothetical protein HDU88_005742 [Geranomyces variabilis]|nr:hypothetical protein HDU88_005742 [Geranomyces variabilis]